MAYNDHQERSGTIYLLSPGAHVEPETQPKHEDQPRSVVSLDHNGQSTRVVCIGGSNVIRLGSGSEGSEPVTVTNVAWPGVLALLVFASMGMAIGVAYADTLRALVR